jgi:hypothetical protein
VPKLAFDYAVVRAVPRVERGEFLNVGVIVYAPAADFLACRLHLHRERLAALSADADADTLDAHLGALRAVCHADPAGGPIASLPLRERFHWLVHPRSAALQVSDVHAGTSDDLPATLQRLFDRYVG